MVYGKLMKSSELSLDLSDTRWQLIHAIKDVSYAYYWQDREILFLRWATDRHAMWDNLYLSAYRPSMVVKLAILEHRTKKLWNQRLQLENEWI